MTEKLAVAPTDERKRSVEDGRLLQVSASQLKTFSACPRKWWFAKVARLPQKPQGKGALLGTQCHKRMEHFLLTGEDVRGEIEAAGDALIRPFLKYAPANGGKGEVEASIAGLLSSPDGVEVTGFIDFIVRDAKKHVTIIDHKFKRDLYLYAETEEQLREDPQAIIYAAAAVENFDLPFDALVEFRHHNHQTNGAKRAFATSIVFDGQSVFEKWTGMTNTIDGEMAAYAGEVDSKKVRCNTSSCGSFGGCDFISQCPDSPHNRALKNSLTGNSPFGINASSTNTGDEMSLLNLLQKSLDQLPPANRPLEQSQSAEPLIAPFIIPTKIETQPAYVQAAPQTDTPVPQATNIDIKATIGMNPRKKRGIKTEEKPVDRGVPPSGFTLLLDCTCEGAVDFSKFVFLFAEELAKEGNVADIRVVPREHDYSYGGWKAAMSRKATELAPDLVGFIYVPRSELSEPIIEVLAAKATRVIRGMR